MEILIIIVIIAICIFLYIALRPTRIEEFLFDPEEMADPEDETPLTNTTYREMNRFNNLAQNSRTDAIIKILEKIHFWITIIGIYYLGKLITAFIQFIAVIIAGDSIFKILKENINLIN